MKTLIAPLFGATLIAASGADASSPGQRCEGLGKLYLPEARIGSTQLVAAGAFMPPTGLPPWMLGDPSAYAKLPEFCRLVVEAAPSTDSAIAIEVWLPARGWNEKLRGQANGGFAGQINYGALASAVLRGYATAATDTGHAGQGTDASWALGHPEKVTDFGYRAIHTMTEVAKVAIHGFYGSRARRSYFTGCSNGGRQALMEVQRFPEDYDGVVSGAPAYAWTRLLTKALADSRALTIDPASYIPGSKLPALAKAVNAACDDQDGLSDGVVGDQPGCRFEPGAMLCKGGEADDCLTVPQVAALRTLYAGPRDARGRVIFPGYLPGSEEGPGGWLPWITGAAPGKSLMFAFATGYFTNMVYEQQDWDYRKADVEAAYAAAVSKTAQTLDATDTNLAPFKARGGKLVLYHGWNDPAISASSTLEYYEGVVARLGKAEADAFLRLYMVPGMQHCAGGPAPNIFWKDGVPDPADRGGDILEMVEQWVEKGTPPGSIVATKFVDDERSRGVAATRPVCPHPLTARYQGQGPPTEASSFACQ